MVSLAKFDMTGNGKIIFIVFISHILQKLTSVSLAEHVDGGYYLYGVSFIEAMILS